MNAGGLRGKGARGWALLGLLAGAVWWPVVAGRGTLLSIQPGLMPDGPWGYSGPRPPAPVWDPAASALKYVPFTRLASEKWRRGEVPFWNPYAGAGVPLLADPEAFATAPLRIPLYLDPSPRMWDAWYLARLWLAGGLAFSLAGWMGLSFVPSLLAGSAYMLSGYMVLNLNLFHLDLDILLPGLFLALGTLVRAPTPGRFAALAAVAWMMCMGGSPQALVVDVLAATAWTAGEVAVRPRGCRLRAAALSALALATGALGALVQWLPMAEFVSRAVTLHEAGSGRSGVATLVPAAMANLAGPWLRAGAGEFYYAGLAAMALASAGVVMAWISRKGPGAVRHGMLAGIALFELAKVFGFPGMRFVGSLPVLETVWWVKYCAPLFLSLALLAALAAERLSRGRAWLALALLVVCAGELALGRPGPFPAPFDPLAPAPYVGWLKERQAREPWARACGVGTTMMPMTATGLGVRDVGMEGSLIDREQYRVLYEGFSAPKPARMTMFVALDRLDARKLGVLKGLGVRHLVARKGWTPPAECAGSLLKAYDAEVTIYRVEGSREFAGFPERGRREFLLGAVLSVLLGGGTLAWGTVAARGRARRRPGRRG